MRVVLADRAYADLEEITDWIGADDWTVRSRSGVPCGISAKHLDPTQGDFRSFCALEPATSAKLSYRDYLIFYRVPETQVEVVRTSMESAIGCHCCKWTSSGSNMAANRPRSLDPASLPEIQAAVARGKADVEAGRVMDAAKAFAGLEACLRALARGDARA